jgi:signal transduction histidine kinase
MADRRVAWPDVALAAVLLVFCLLGTGPAALNQGRSAPPASYALVVIACLSVAIWRWRPMWTFAVVGSATMVYIGLGYAYGPIMITLAVAVYGLARWCTIRRAMAGMAVLLAASLVAVGIGVATGSRDWPEFVSVAAWSVIPAAAGAVLKVRRDAAVDVRAEQARRAISEERLQLAQEVHDVVGHGLAVIAMQAGVALRVLEREPARVREALEAIRATSRDALEGLRAELDALRNGSGAATRRPTTGLADLPWLAERMRSSGLTVAVELNDPAGELTALPTVVDHAAYRIIQEALTNVLRHGGPAATARVRIGRDDGVLEVEVLDTGVGAAGPPHGHGIDGMRQRAHALGGSFDAGGRPGGGFAVRARLPCGAVAGVPGGPA